MTISSNLGSNPGSQPGDLQREVERLRRTVENLQSWAQLLAGGLILALLIAMGMASWFALSLELQKRESRNEARQFAADRKDFIAQVEAVQSQVAVLEERIADEGDLGGQVRNNRQTLLQLRERLATISRQVDSLQSRQESAAPTPPDPQP